MCGGGGGGGTCVFKDVPFPPVKKNTKGRDLYRI